MPFKSFGKSLTTRLGTTVLNARSVVGDVMNVGKGDGRSEAMLSSIEQSVLALVFAAVVCYGSEFLPFWACLIGLGVGFAAVFSADKHFYPVFCRTALGACAAFVAFSQPWGAVMGAVGLAGWASYRAWTGTLGHWAKWPLAAFVLTLLASAAVYLGLAAFVVPVLHPLTVVAYNVGPLVFVGAGVLTCLYTSWRLTTDPVDELYYRLAPGACALLFVLFYPMKNSWIGLGVEAAFVAAAFAVAFLGSRRIFVLGTASGVVFSAAFVLMNGSSFFYDVAMAQSMNVRYVDALPETVNNRIMPIIVGRDFCVQGNDGTMLQTGETHAQIMDGKFYWQCPMHYTGFQVTHLFSWFPGSTAGFVMVDAGTTASDTRVIPEGFVFGENSFFVKAAFEARHPGATMSGFSYAAAAGKPGSFSLLIPYTVNKLYWGAMVPTLGGVMVVSPWGTVEDYTVGQAARAFPGTYLFPSDLARRYADVWGKRTVGKLVTRSSLEVSESMSATSGRLSNPIPYGIDTVAGPKYFVPYEPEGKNGTAMSDVAFFDGAAGDAEVTVMHVADSKQPGANSNTFGHRSIQGPREILEKSANVIQGHFQLTSIEPIIVVTKDNRFFFITANMGPDTNKSNHDYQGDTLSYETGEPQWVVTSSAEVDRHVRETEAQMDGSSAAPAVAPVAAPAPAKTPTPAVSAPQSN
jgi:hypothetical protein